MVCSTTLKQKYLKLIDRKLCKMICRVHDVCSITLVYGEVARVHFMAVFHFHFHFADWTYFDLQAPNVRVFSANTQTHTQQQQQQHDI